MQAHVSLRRHFYQCHAASVPHVASSIECGDGHSITRIFLQHLRKREERRNVGAFGPVQKPRRESIVLRESQSLNPVLNTIESRKTGHVMLELSQELFSHNDALRFRKARTLEPPIVRRFQCPTALSLAAEQVGAPGKRT